MNKAYLNEHVRPLKTLGSSFIAQSSHLSLSTTDDIQDAAWDQFVESSAEGKHVQTSSWAKLKQDSSWQSSRVAVKDHGQIVAGAQILSKSVAPFIRLGYVSKGPLLASHDKEVIDLLLKGIKEEMHKLGLFALIMQPPSFEELLINTLAEQGFAESGMHMLPTATAVIDCQQDDLLATMPKRVRNLIRRALKKGVTLREGTEADLETFYKLYMTVSQKKDFHSASFEQFQREWELLHPAGYLRLFIAEVEGEAVAANWLISFGDTLKASRYGWSGEHKDKSPIEGMDYLTMLWAKEHAYKYYDLDGINPEAARAVAKGEPLPEAFRNTPTFFKLKYNSKVVFYPEPLILFRLSPLNWLYKKLFRSFGNHPLLHKLFNRMRVS